MAVTSVKEYQRQVIGINCFLEEETVGWLEAVDFPISNTEATVFARGNLLCQLRAAFLPSNCTIVKGICGIVGRNNKTLKTIQSPIVGKFPLSTEVSAVGAANATLGASGNGTIMTKAPTIEIADELLVDDPDIAPLFRAEGEAFNHTSRHFNGIPDGYVQEFKAEGLDPDFAWFDAGGGTAITVAPTVEKNLWANMKVYFNYLIQTACIAKPHELAPGEVPDPNKVYDLIPYQRFYFERMSKKKCGRPIGLRRAKAAIAS